MNIKDFIHGAIAFISLMSVLSGFLLLNGMYWGGML
jgi:hypothetical protein